MHVEIPYFDEIWWYFDVKIKGLTLLVMNGEHMVSIKWKPTKAKFCYWLVKDWVLIKKALIPDELRINPY